jgi:HD superfamily phosphohydrolase
MDGWAVRVPADPKLVRDAVHGYQLLAPYEVAVIDTPVIQRLRRIHQTALAYFVYPSATHSRFDHVLGVAEMVNGLCRGLDAYGEKLIGSDSHARMRLAALVHDSGHIFMSHLGEAAASLVYADAETEAKDVGGDLFEAKSLGEILSYLIVTSPPMTKAITESVGDSKVYGLTPEHVASLCLGKSPDPLLQYEADVISGPFDADKLDYLLRDSHFSGIRSTVDIERVFYTVRLLRTKDAPRHLAMHISGVPTLEQLLLARMMLYPAVYHHQKVRALECTFMSLIETIVGRSGELTAAARLKPDNFARWMHITDDRFLTLCLDDPVLTDAANRIVNRRPLRRALVLSWATIEDPDTLKALRRDAEDPLKLRKLREAIHANMPAGTRGAVENVWLDLPSPPTFLRDIQHVRITEDLEAHQPMSEGDFGWKRWMDNYEQIKFRGHIFCLDQEDVRRDAAKAAEAVLAENFGMKLKPTAWSQAHNTV